MNLSVVTLFSKRLNGKTMEICSIAHRVFTYPLLKLVKFYWNLFVCHPDKWKWAWPLIASANLCRLIKSVCIRFWTIIIIYLWKWRSKCNILGPMNLCRKCWQTIRDWRHHKWHHDWRGPLFIREGKQTEFNKVRPVRPETHLIVISNRPYI